MTKSEIVSAVYAKVGGFSKKEAADIVEMLFETVKDTLGRGEKIKISGFGNFVLRDKRQRRGRNPQTGQPLTITERRVLTFKASQILKSILNPDETQARDGGGASASDDGGSDSHGHPGGSSPSGVIAVSAQETPPASSATAGMEINYANNTGGLEKLAKDILKAQKESNAFVAGKLLQSLILPTPRAWYTENFPPALAASGAADYEIVSAKIPA